MLDNDLFKVYIKNVTISAQDKESPKKFVNLALPASSSWLHNW